jgi:hypothetical protein
MCPARNARGGDDIRNKHSSINMAAILLDLTFVGESLKIVLVLLSDN